LDTKCVPKIKKNRDFSKANDITPFRIAELTDSEVLERHINEVQAIG
jgi:hypothetical protein